MKSRLPRLILLGAFVAAVGWLVAWWFLPAPLRGEVMLTGFDGESQPAVGAEVALYPSGPFLSHLRKQMAHRPVEMAAAEERLSVARNEWERCAAQRTEAAKALRVAERTNAADLEASRARHEAALRAEALAYERLEALTGEREALDGVARLFEGLGQPLFAGRTDDEGKFFLRAPRRKDFFLVARARADGRFDAVWVKEVGALREPLDLTNGNLATIEALGSLAAGK